jgi:hypothetical protein
MNNWFMSVSRSCHILETQSLSTVGKTGRNKREAAEDVGIDYD